MQDLLSTLARQGQDALTGAVRTWADSVQRLYAVPGTPVLDVTTVVDVVFDLAEQVLAAQRELTKAVLRAVTP